MPSAARNLRIVRLFALLVTFTSGVVHESVAQDAVAGDPNLTITTFKAPKGYSLDVLVGEATIWFYSKNELFRLDPKSNQFGSVAIEEMQVPKGIDLNRAYAAGGASIWRLGKAHDVEGVHQVDPVTGKCIGAIPLKMRVGSYALVYKGQTRKYVLARIDPKTHETISKIECDDSRGAPALWNGSVWLSTAYYHLSGHFLTKVNPRTNHIAWRVLIPAAKRVFMAAGSMPPSLAAGAAGDDSLWVLR